MGYTIKIGNIVNDRVEDVNHPNAPADGVPTDHTNSRWPSYSGWADFCDQTGISAIMDELMPDHPGIAKLEARHLEAINEAAKQDMTTGNRVRMEWLQYWMKWAIENCENPAVYND